MLLWAFALKSKEFMKRFIYQAHLILGIFVSVPVLAWALSGLLYALPNMVEGGTVEKIDTARVKVSPADAMTKANELSGKPLPTTALTLLMKDGRPQYQSIGGLGADSIFIDAESGEASFSKPPTWKTRFFREAHFYFFAGSWQVTLLILFSALTALSALTGIYLNIVYWFRRPRAAPPIQIETEM
ncbi:MAG TPA: PepSY domain-containing protein [Pyrinomonadaceae bacterium]|nr:PepSY domain-containing protein [Pyrinomonadaceae bacterium]